MGLKVTPINPHNVTPAFIWAPTARCGVTMLQRLVTSSRHMLVYGENSMITRYMPLFILEMSENQESRDEARERLVKGDYGFWSSSAFPHMEAYYGALVQNFYSLVAVYEAATKAEGFKRWCIKEPVKGWNAYFILRRLLPASQHVFIYRHVEDVAKSYKSRTWSKTPEDFRSLGTEWAQNVRMILQIGNDDKTVHLIRYETMMADKAGEAERLRAYLNLPAMDVSIFDKKVNTFQGEEARGHAQNQYIDPSELTGPERHALYSTAGDALPLGQYERRG